MDHLSAQRLLLMCDGDEIWDEQTCRQAGVPTAWIQELRDCFESGFDADRNSIYVDRALVNQYEGVRAVDLAFKLADYLGIDWRRATSHCLSRQAKVNALIAELDEL